MRNASWPPSPFEVLPAERDLLNAAERMNRQIARSMVQVIPGSEFEEFEKFYVRSYPLPTETLNEARITGLPSDPIRVVEQARAYFQNRSPLWRLVCPPEWQASLIEPCHKAGLSLSPPTPELILASDHYQRTPAEIDCRRVESISDLETFEKTFLLANELPDSGFWQSNSLLDAPEWDLMLGYVDGKPVATGFGFTSDEITGVWGIATLPAFRGKGMGTAITWAVLNAGLDKGARAAYLWATELGFPIYLKMGFRHVQNKTNWIYRRPGSS
jgi:N-acetylglutamate synthase